MLDFGINIKATIVGSKRHMKLKYGTLPASKSAHFHHILRGHNHEPVIIAPSSATHSSPQRPRCPHCPRSELCSISLGCLKFGIDMSQYKWKKTGRKKPKCISFKKCYFSLPLVFLCDRESVFGPSSMSLTRKFTSGPTSCSSMLPTLFARRTNHLGFTVKEISPASTLIPSINKENFPI